MNENSRQVHMFCKQVQSKKECEDCRRKEAVESLLRYCNGCQTWDEEVDAYLKRKC